ncbi:MAG TPA: SDR family NAD(P)-dependent oxidoreductase [Terriglobales bacterium]|nr:SDR family NAD(P)-dependent oxidoreductase [Terriglobales bacterium]
MSGRFAGRQVLVTGAAHGFGRAIAIAFAHQGAKVIACDIIAAEVAETARIAGNGCESCVLDVTDPAAVKDLAAEIGDRVDILVNNAGGVRGQSGRPIEQITPQDWHDVVDVNMTAVFLMAQAVAPGMKARRWGRIVNISSGAGLGISLTGIQAYASAKAGQIGLTRQLAHELGPWNITVNNVAPGFIRSNPATERQWEAMGAAGQERLVQNIALKRLGQPEDIANAVLFFASEEANWISGQVLSVDGGK